MWLRAIQNFLGDEIFEQIPDKVMNRFIMSFYARVSFAVKKSNRIENWIQETLILRMLCNEIFGTNEGMTNSVAGAPQLYMKKAYEEEHFRAHLEKFNAQTKHYLDCLQNPDYIPPSTVGWTPELKMIFIEELRKYLEIDVSKVIPEVITEVIEVEPEVITEVIEVEPEVITEVKPNMETATQTDIMGSDIVESETEDYPKPEVINMSTVNQSNAAVYNNAIELNKFMNDMKNTGITVHQVELVNRITMLAYTLGINQERALFHGCITNPFIEYIIGEYMVDNQNKGRNALMSPVPHTFNNPNIC
ncbi:hypothetical protein EB093_09885 [bacterium]|nr:hypothetical protein [bacterium]